MHNMDLPSVVLSIVQLDLHGVDNWLILELSCKSRVPCIAIKLLLGESKFDLHGRTAKKGRSSPPDQ
jgi:hypothetical protein